MDMDKVQEINDLYKDLKAVEKNIDKLDNLLNGLIVSANFTGKIKKGNVLRIRYEDYQITELDSVLIRDMLETLKEKYSLWRKEALKKLEEM